MKDPTAVQFDMAGYVADSGANPHALEPFAIGVRPGLRFSTFSAFIDDQAASIVRRSPTMKHPYLVPGAIYNSLWTWDAYFAGLGLLPAHGKAFSGSLLNLLDNVREDGRAPGRVDVDGTPEYQHAAQPLHAQWSWRVAASQGGADFLRTVWPTLTRIRKWHDDHCLSRRGLYSWIDGSGTGIDNDPAIYGRAGSAVALVDVNCFHFRELSAMAAIAEKLGDESADSWRRRAEDLRDAINAYMWDPESETYYHVDLSQRPWQTFQTPTWELRLKTQTWANLFPLWCGVATPDRADRLIRGRVLEPDEFLSGYGIRSSPRSEGFYNNLPMANPSNWQGPVWGLSTFLTCYGLARYGYVAEARRIAGRLIGLMSDDIRHNGTIHEYYDAETGAPLFNPGFISWNTLGARIIENIDAGIDPTDLG